MNNISLIYLITVLLFFVIAVINIIISIVRYRKKNIQNYLSSKESRQKKFANGK